MRRGLFLLPLLASCRAALVANPVNEAVFLDANLTAAVCGTGRTLCNVLIDIPAACAGNTSKCPVILCFHGHGSHNTVFSKEGVKSMSKSVHNHSFIGVYPQVPLLCNTVVDVAVLLCHPGCMLLRSASKPVVGKPACFVFSWAVSRPFLRSWCTASCPA